MDLINTYRPQRRRRKSKPKAKAKCVVMHVLFNGWQDLPPKSLEQRVAELRQLGVERYRFNTDEWNTLDKMRDKMRANAKFEQSLRELNAAKPGHLRGEAAGPSP
jgi:hypothetical protein